MCGERFSILIVDYCLSFSRYNLQFYPKKILYEYILESHIEINGDQYQNSENALYYLFPSSNSVVWKITFYTFYNPIYW